MTPEELIGPAAAKALAEHYDLTPKAKPLPDVVTMEEFRRVRSDYANAPCNEEREREVFSAFVLRWLRARLVHEKFDFRRAPIFKDLTGREWTS